MATKLQGASISSSCHPPPTKNSLCKIKVITTRISIQRTNQARRRISKISCCSDIGAASTNSRSQNKRPLTTTDLTGSFKDGSGIRVAYQA
uniref:Uncharacterized protein n=1 Tax=Lactuca sativa TaxID=4236 RepID=A0A9R1UIP2_LACSA|nr:hypothetical protein LSAT_V11C900484090 [Lactuca sativa]